MISPSSQDPAFVCSERPVELRPRSVRAAGIEIGTVKLASREERRSGGPRLQPDPIVDSIVEALLTAEIALRRLNRLVA